MQKPLSKLNGFVSLSTLTPYGWLVRYFKCAYILFDVTNISELLTQYQII